MNSNNNYIYLHKRNDTGEVFYVGRGTGERMFKNSSRSSLWKDIVKTAGFTAEVYKGNLSFEDAHAIEVSLISDPPTNWNLINKNIPVILSYEKDFLSKYFQIDPSSPSGLSHARTTKKTKIGQRAGAVSQDGYWKVCVDKKSYRASRVVVALNGGIIPVGYVVNHIDGNPLNNKIENLEVVTHAENNGRCKFVSNKRRTDNTTGVHGISHCKTKNRYITSITIDGKRTRKVFNYNNDNRQDVFNEAVEYLDAIKRSILFNL